MIRANSVAEEESCEMNARQCDAMNCDELRYSIRHSKIR